jgi:hypothetical protein
LAGGGDRTVALLGHGYLGALLEWGLIEPNVYNSLSALLSAVGNNEQHELFADEPL